MPNRILVAMLATVGLLSSTLALAEVTDSPAAKKTLVNALEAPALVAANVATPAVVEPETEISNSEHASDVTDGAAAPDQADSLDELVQTAELDDVANDDARCLATAVYYESRSESLSGQLAVANVVLQRAKSGRFPSSLCGVVTQPGQFSFVRGGRLPATPSNANQWRTAQAIAQIAMDGSWNNPVQGALYFHSSRVSPGWGKERVTRIGGHVFYR